VGACHSDDELVVLDELPSASSSDYIAKRTFQSALFEQGLSSNGSGMLSNGARFYLDPSGPEYSTPECTTAEEATIRSFDGDRIVFGVMRYLQKVGEIETFQLNRRVVDHTRSSRGVHLNTATVHDNKPSKKLIHSLATLNVAKGAIFGSGGLLVDRYGDTAFHHSPRLSLTNKEGMRSSSFVDRPLVRHPFQDDYECRRVETITSDALNFAWPLRASMVMTNALLKLTEAHEEYDGLPQLTHAIRSARMVGRYGNGTLVDIDFEGAHKQVKPVEIITKLAELALIEQEKYRVA
jgi:hypothetical protein